MLYLLILLLGSASYIVGIRQMLRGRYAPSVFSRIVWLLLSVNSFAAVVASGGSSASILLAGLLLTGNLMMCVISLKKGSRTFGRIEIVCLLLLFISGVLWLVIDVPLINLGLSLGGHLLGGIPTYRRVWLEPKSEDTTYWSLFFMASVLSVVASGQSSLHAIIFPLYFTLFDGSIFLLSVRRSRTKN
jgi:hypothetical protein